MAALQRPAGAKAQAATEAAPASSTHIDAKFAWTEYEELMISEAHHRGEHVYNVALRIDGKSFMRAAAFQLIRNVLHGCGRSSRCVQKTTSPPLPSKWSKRP